MKKAELIFSAILVPVDYLMLILAGLTAYAIRFSDLYQEAIREVVFALDFGAYMGLVWQLAILWVLLFALAGLYAIRPRGRAEEVAKVFLACSAGIMAVVIIIFLQRELFASRFIVLAAWILAIIFVSLGRIIVRSIQIRLLRRGVGVHKVALIGVNCSTTDLKKVFVRRPELGVEVTHEFGSGAGEDLRNITELAKARQIDEIIQGDSSLPRDESLALIDIAHEYHIDFRYAADLLATTATNISVNTLSGVPLVEIQRTKLDGWGRILKKVFDVLVSFIGSILLIPVFLIIALIIKLDSRGPVFVKLQRIGAAGKPFYTYKFRSMVPGADKMKQELMDRNERADGPLFKMKNDPRITRFGRFLRQNSLDELPQLLNVLKGEMSLVGPRPHEPGEVAQYQKHHKHLLEIKPGMTGMAQVSGRANLKFEDEVKLDVYYIENWSMKLDIIILLRTPIVVFSRTAAV